MYFLDVVGWSGWCRSLPSIRGSGAAQCVPARSIVNISLLEETLHVAFLD